MDMTINYTGHAAHRQAQRNLSEQDIEFVVEHGRMIRSGGALHVFLGRRDIPADREVQRQYGRLEGTTLVVKDSGQEAPTLITAYRNRRGYKQIRRKSRYDRWPER